MNEKDREMLDRLAKRYKKNNEHIKQNYDRVSIALPKGIKPRIIDTGESLNSFIINAVIKSLEEREAAAKAGPGEDQTPAAAGEAPPRKKPGPTAPAEELDPISEGATAPAHSTPEEAAQAGPAEDPAKAAEDPDRKPQEIKPAEGPAQDPHQIRGQSWTDWTPGPAFLFGSFDMDPEELPFK